MFSNKIQPETRTNRKIRSYRKLREMAHNAEKRMKQFGLPPQLGTNEEGNLAPQKESKCLWLGDPGRNSGKWVDFY